MTHISIIVLNWNSKKYLMHCIGALQKQTYRDFEVLIINNGSPNIIQKMYSDLYVRFFSLPTNEGFAVANNIGARLARGKWIALLNADAFPEADWLENLLKASERYPDYSIFTSRQIQVNKPWLLDGTGDNYHISGLAWRRCYNLSRTQNGLKPEEVFSACGAAAIYLKDDFLQAGGLDDDFFSYFEDVDLGFRLRLAGKKCLYVPDAVVHHVGSASTGKRSDFSVYYGYRNMIWTFFKNMPSPLIWFLLPVHIVTIMFFILYLTLRGQGKVILRAVLDAVRGTPRILEKRKVIQRNIKVKPFELLKVMSTGLLEPYLEFQRRNQAK